MAPSFSKSQIDRLGERLKRGEHTEAALRALAEYRQSFADAHRTVVGAIRNHLKLRPTGRPRKSTTSITEKLQRETIRLSQVQDIAGCRVLVRNLWMQDRVVSRLQGLFPLTSTIDRREHPSHGYRAVHVIANIEGRAIEVQVRTALQHLWTQVSERLSDRIDPGLKYGRGPSEVRNLLRQTAERVAVLESLERQCAQLKKECAGLQTIGKAPGLADIVWRLKELTTDLNTMRQDTIEILKEIRAFSDTMEKR